MKSRQKFPPGGWKFFSPHSKWSLPPNLSFDVAVQTIRSHRLGNPYLAQTHNLSTDSEIISDELDSYNAMICQKMGWLDYIQGGASEPPKSTAPQFSRGFLDVAAGLKPIVEWLSKAEEAVSVELAEARANTCVACPLNSRGDWTRHFTVPLTNAIRQQLEIRRGWKMSTSQDESLGICDACGCVLKLKIHMGLDYVLKATDESTRQNLDKNCWIINERQ